MPGALIRGNMVFQSLPSIGKCKRAASNVASCAGSKSHVVHLKSLPQESPNDLKLSILGNYEISGKPQNFCQNKNFVNTSKKHLKNRNWTFHVVLYFTWKLEFVLNTFSMFVSGNSVLLLTCLSHLQTWFVWRFW